MRAGSSSLRKRKRQHVADVVSLQHAHQQTIHAQRDARAIGQIVQHRQQIFVNRAFAQAAFAAARARLMEARLDAEVVGGAAAFGADSFNEQVIQGLRAEEATR